MTVGAGLPARLPGRVADELAERVLRQTIAAGLLPGGELPDWERYHAFRALVRREFVVPETSITPLMARVLYGIAYLARPRRILGVGTYCGNAMVWLTGPGFGPSAVYQGTRAVGVDTDPAATRTAQENFGRLGGDPRIELRCMDGHEAGDDTFDLVLLDADDPVRRKGIYLSLLDALYPHVAPGGLVLAHDICVPLFAEQLGEYRRATRDEGRFSASASLPIDPCGLEVSRTGPKTVFPASNGLEAGRATMPPEPSGSNPSVCCRRAGRGRGPCSTGRCCGRAGTRSASPPWSPPAGGPRTTSDGGDR